MGLSCWLSALLTHQNISLFSVSPSKVLKQQCNNISENTLFGLEPEFRCIIYGLFVPVIPDTIDNQIANGKDALFKFLPQRKYEYKIKCPVSLILEMKPYISHNPNLTN